LPSRDRLTPSGVCGLADPTGVDPSAFFSPTDSEVQCYELDLARLAAFRADREMRGFFWKSEST
jgi:hypothetical protein